MYSDYKALLKEKAKIDSKIRARRIIDIRACIAGEKLYEPLAHLIKEMDRRLLSHYFNYEEFDDLLDLIESKI